ncbi:MAG TPA: SpoIID/LytB domain-containing protein [Gaiellaceae bacterium]|nr:SpoIID/LytB domain-containing protein [Gaiellaceae bacterium]
MIRRALSLAALAALLTAASANARSVCTGSCYAAPAGSGALFVFTGHGWGHGVGMSQYGAYGYAQHGWTYPKILAHYYPGTKLGKTATTTIRVLLADRQKTLKISSTVPFTVTDGSGAAHTLAAGTFGFGTGLRLPVDGGALQPLTAPLTFTPGAGGPLTLGRAYRGQILVDVVDGKLRAINILPLEQYLAGVVPAEMPSTWLPDALEAQAIASRSYALATRQLAAPFDVYSDTRSQMYLGIGSEQPSTTAAVAATAGQVLLYKGAVATTVFFSSSGGQTSSNVDAWGGKPLPYLVSVPDPYDVISPFHDWGPVPVTAQTLAKALHVVGTVADVTTTLNLSGRVSQLDLTTLSPASTFPLESTVGANTVLAALGLRSTWFDVGVLSLAPPVPSLPIPYGSTVQLSGLVRGVAGVSLEQRPSAATWQPLGPVVTQPDGTVQLTETPTITTDYRLATPQAAAAYVRIKVMPVVTLAPPAVPTMLQGTITPALPGAPVQIQQLSPTGLTWTTVATGTVDPTAASTTGATGTFTVPLPLTPGTYRAVIAPGHGYSPGTSAPLTVSG